MQESKKISLFLGTVSMEKELGYYYINMRPALIHYTQNIYGGKFDEQGVPMIKLEDESVYSPINIAQYGFMLHAEWLETKEDKILQILKNCISVLEQTKTEKNNICVWYHKTHEQKYNIHPPWASSMAQGEVISFYLRMYQILNDENLLQTSLKAYNFLQVDFKDGGVRRVDSEGNLWFEEYPSSKPSLVLNGFIYTLFGLYDLYRVTNNKEVKQDIDRSIQTLTVNLHKYDAGYWSVYDLLKKELVRYYYQKNVHVPQMEILYLLTNEPVFRKYQLKWEKQLTPLNFLFVQIMYRLKPRIDRLKNRSYAK
ncbi:MAG TPA: hypothetical protein DCQ26_01475 [Marinilabiliales bacterium]|nr:MAG: hypothetical protein A2W84_16070 [Bacteroidetes bacterium GWC2_40_13]OFX75884.1 MAG: hypothetical protein A2W96_05945 [Bacteroidetes bacterium GWD2_40_43]OFX88622.1 MAG: hypothetical protein A2W97_01140 [Bacteroidetes bacterium GWE2_40_63]OFY20350.1 MAG: hypothetical protein A2W88_18065 [Bacteroidetes bacterium GWF2_40_13]OFZ24729.1 MAG: hypothetical protein A2437_02505 [Bacteroidetes bacterium RIFOXYC2_FULL_40_12]HAM97253.1 hypothetical protein [Marinilabiliales bacterium]